MHRNTIMQECYNVINDHRSKCVSSVGEGTRLGTNIVRDHSQLRCIGSGHETNMYLEAVMPAWCHLDGGYK